MRPFIRIRGLNCNDSLLDVKWAFPERPERRAGGPIFSRKERISSILGVITVDVVAGQEDFSSAPGLRAGLFSDLSARDTRLPRPIERSCQDFRPVDLRWQKEVTWVTRQWRAGLPFGILAFVELRLPPQISHETGDPSEGWGVRAQRAKKRRCPPGSRVRKTLLPLFIELSRRNTEHGKW